MALTLTELMVVPGTGNKRMVIYKVMGDGTSNSVNVIDIKMSKVEVAWTVNVDAEYHKEVVTKNVDYLAAPTSTIEIGDSAIAEDAIQSGKYHLLIVIGY